MAVTGGLNTAQFTKGPGLLYLQCGVPLADASLVLTAGVPAMGHMVGYTVDGNEISWGRESTSVNADETSAAIDEVISAETLTISGTAYQLEDMELLEALLPTGTLEVAAGGSILKFGGLSSLTDKGQIDGAILVWLMKNQTTKYARFHLYDCVNTGDSAFRVTRVAYGTMPYVLTGRPVPSRTAGDQLGQLALDPLV